MIQPKHLIYFVHDLTDSTVHKRVRMFVDGGCHVTVIGFSRGKVPTTIHGAEAVSLGKSYDGKFLHRILLVLKTVLFNRACRNHIGQADAIVARTIEMLAISVRARTHLSKPAPLVYESLDIHRLLLNEGVVGQILRQLEKWLMKRCDLLLTSSPAFVREYFEKRHISSCPVYIIENKVYVPEDVPLLARPRSDSLPWKIGWFGAIRCRKSLQILSHLARSANGDIEVIIRGKPSYDQFDDFDAQVSIAPHVRFEGPYKNPGDLERIYNDVHFTWAIDMFEEGLNSTWLLPNRIYEGGRYGSVPIAQRDVETGQYLSRLGLGVVLNNPLEQNLEKFFSTLTPSLYENLLMKSKYPPSSTWTIDRKDAEHLVQRILNAGVV